MFLLRLFRRLLGRCECGENKFTRWEMREGHFIVAPQPDPLTGIMIDTHRVTRVWQERTCVTCGATYQRSLKTGGPKWR